MGAPHELAKWPGKRPEGGFDELSFWGFFDAYFNSVLLIF